MRIAIDGEFLRLPPSGIGGYVRHLIPALRAAASEFEIVTLLPPWDQSNGTAPAGRAPWRDRRLQRMAWEAAGVEAAALAKRADLLHVPSFAAPVRSLRPLVVTVHDVIPFVLPAYRASRAMRAHLALMQRTVRAARLVVAPSVAAADDIAAILAIPRDRIRVTPEAADPACRPADDPSAARERIAAFGIRGRYVFNVGGLDVRKNVPLLIEAFARVRAGLAEPVQLVIAGAPHSDNPAVFPPLHPVIDQFGLRNDVVLTGRIGDAEKLALYQAAACYVTPSAYEGFGLTALEAMACGVPTIAANRTSLPEVVGDGGLLCEPDADAVAAVLELVLRQPEAARDLRARGLERAAQFTWERTANLTLDVYREALAAASQL